MRPAVSFVLLDDPRPLRYLSGLDPDSDWREFVSTTSAWVLQTCLRLKQAGHDVGLRDSLPDDGIAVVSNGDYRRLLRHRWSSTDATLVAARGSFRRTPPFADIEIVQNPTQADGKRRFLVPHWPQPGLMPRDPGRDATIMRAAFKGFPDQLRRDFQGPEWLDFLRSNGIEWLYDSVPYADVRTESDALSWPDYRTVDLIIAVRAANPSMYRDRPATKLYNGWLAGVPCILGPESAYRALRRDELDYIEVANVAEARAAVRRLLNEPALYRAMVGRARERAAGFTVERVASTWAELLFERLPALAASDPWMRSMRGLPLQLRQVAGRVRWATLSRRPARSEAQ
jgi:hypothetical protein